MSLTVKHVDSIRPFISQALADAVKVGSRNLADLHSMLEIAKRTGDASLISEIESRIANDSQTVKAGFALALVEACDHLGLPIVTKSGYAPQGNRRGRKVGSKNKVKSE
jgi:hypothetical protein